MVHPKCPVPPHRQHLAGLSREGMLLGNPDLGSDVVSATVSIWLMGSVGVELLRELVWGCRSHEWGALSLHVGRGHHPTVPAPPPPRLSAPSPERRGWLRLAEGFVGPRSEMGRPGVGGPREGRSVGLGMVSIPTWDSVVSVSQSCLTAGGLNLAFILFWLGCESEVKGWEGPHCLPRLPRRLLPASVSFLHSARTCVPSCMQPSWLRSSSPKPQVPSIVIVT